MLLLRIPYALVQWALSVLVYAPLVAIGLPAVALGLVSDGARNTPKMWELWGSVEDIPVADKKNRWTKWKYMALRNPVMGLDKYIPRADVVTQYGDSDMESPGFKIRWRNTTWRDSLRITWGDSRAEGKKEVYVGYKIGADVDNTSFTAQLRL